VDASALTILTVHVRDIINKNEGEYMETKRFAFIAGNEVFMQFTLGPSQNQEMFTAGLQSNPIVVDITDMGIPEGPLTGWIWDGNTIRKPE